MHYLEDWRAISAWIHGLENAGTTNTHQRALAKELRVQQGLLLDELHGFVTQHDGFLPPAASNLIKAFVAEHSQLIRSRDPDMTEVIVGHAQAGLAFLKLLEARITYLLSDSEHAIRSRVERAFLHLQRSMVADEDFRKKWQHAFDNGGERACEKLGGVHMLLHGIWAFKVDGAGERTDLVCNEPIDPAQNAQASVDGFVLTEWKITKNAKVDEAAFENARQQARRYGSGILAGTTLKTFRYVVVVSRDHISVPNDMKEGDVTYRHINIPVEPSSPSK